MTATEKENEPEKDSEKDKAPGARSSRVIKLNYPIEWGSEGLVDQITLKRPKGRHMRNINKDVGMDELLNMASRCSGKPSRFFDEMDGSDCIEVSVAIQDFLDNGQEIGPTY